MDELSVLHEARTFINGLDLTNIKNDLSVYLRAANAKLVKEALDHGESGTTFTRPDGRHIVTVNSRESEERQRFTVCHEIAHIILKLDSCHEGVPAWSYVKRNIDEVYCDIFAAELLMPVSLWKSLVPDDEPSEEIIRVMGSAFRCSFPAAASRYATLANFPCAYVTIDRGTIRYAARSTKLRSAQAWIPPKTKAPQGSIAEKLRSRNQSVSETSEVAQDTWFQDWESGLYLTEMSRHYHETDSTVSLLWFGEDELPAREFDRFRKPVVDDGLLSELTGELPWPGLSKRR